MSMHRRSTKRKLEELQERLKEIREEYQDLDTDIFDYHAEASVMLDHAIMYLNFEANELEL